MEYTHEDILKNLEGYDIAFTERRKLFILYPKRQAKACSFKYRMVHDLKDIIRNSDREEYIPFDEYFSFTLGSDIKQMVLNRYRVIIYVPQTLKRYPHSGGCLFIDMISIP
ncbi:hypothetical protein BFG07_00880 [Kosakonia cowanii]|uniref:hypothetical protein n=1 Tax=Kosakonia cowanii TaxID=208223 RepID=UPI000B95D9B4|nr:hypothetical protein [Kosakonia cowanii]AST67377.1 hypothetical protein BFG07_00880 [Kosakonia cowanii]